jgi:hypothetical protein
MYKEFPYQLVKEIVVNLPTVLQFSPAVFLDISQT